MLYMIMTFLMLIWASGILQLGFVLHEVIINFKKDYFVSHYPSHCDNMFWNTPGPSVRKWDK